MRSGPADSRSRDTECRLDDLPEASLCDPRLPGLFRFSRRPGDVEGEGRVLAPERHEGRKTEGKEAGRRGGYCYATSPAESAPLEIVQGILTSRISSASTVRRAVIS
jgi:hypothetical protein